MCLQITNCINIWHYYFHVAICIYGCCSFLIGKCAYKLQIALIDGATFKIQFAYGFCKLCNMQMILQIKKLIKRWPFFPVAIFIRNWPKKMFAKDFHSHIYKEKKIQIIYSMWGCRNPHDCIDTASLTRGLVLAGNPAGRPGTNYLGGE